MTSGRASAARVSTRRRETALTIFRHARSHVNHSFVVFIQCVHRDGHVERGFLERSVLLSVDVLVYNM